MNLPNVSVIMPVFNAEAFLNEAIDSILEQSLSNIELIIINDGSTDGSLEIIKSYIDKRIVLINQVNQGNSASRNNGIKTAKGNLIAILDADDIALKERLEKQANFLELHPDYVAIGSNAEVIDKEGNTIFFTKNLISNESIIKALPTMPFIHSTIMFRKDAFYSAGQYPLNLSNIAEDMILVNRISRFGKLANLPEVLVKYRIVPNSVSIRNIKQQTYIRKVLPQIINGNTLTNYDEINLHNLQKSPSLDTRMSDYHLFLAKKYLWNNYNRKSAKSNLRLSLSYKYNTLSFLLLLMSSLPNNWLNFLYSFLKSKKIYK